jgi:FeS assembly SUF system protein
MGIFSFLKNKPAETEAPDSPGGAAAADRATGPTAEAGDEPVPFAVPEFNIDAFTTPVADAPSGSSQVGPMDSARTAELQPQIVEALKSVYDPEIPVDIYELGLVYDIIVDAERRVLVRMTLTSPACPSAQQIPSEARYKIKALPGVADAWVDIVWDPPWGKERMSEAAKLQLGFF